MWKVEAFWQYSLALYKQPQVKSCCLTLQDQSGFNVNLLLLCCYINQSELQLQLSDLKVLLKAIMASEAQLAEIRSTRRAAKGSKQYQTLLSQELALEKRQQSELVNCLNTLTLQKGDNDNLVAYAELMSATMQPPQAKTLKELTVLASTHLTLNHP